MSHESLSKVITIFKYHRENISFNLKAFCVYHTNTVAALQQKYIM